MTNVKVTLPRPYKEQAIFIDWLKLYPVAQILVIPCGTKAGKSFGASIFLTKAALTNPGSYCAWIAPTYLKARIGYRYMKSMMPTMTGLDCIDGKLEIRLPNGTYIKFLHGKDAETTVEGEAIDFFVIDEAGKIDKQVFYSLLTTITQTKGRGIVTGTPRGFTWYYDIYKQAVDGNPFYCHATLMTAVSPYVTADSIAHAKRILPRHLFDQYYRAVFGSVGTIFGDLSGIFNDLEIDKKNFWIHPDPETRKLDTFTGWDIAKSSDYSVFKTVTTTGKLVGFARFKRVPYDQQVERLNMYAEKFFPESDKVLYYDNTGVGSAVGDIINAKDIDMAVNAITWTNAVKQQMVNKLMVAVETGWLDMPRIEVTNQELASYEVSITKSGQCSYSAPAGHNDDCVSALMMAVSGAYGSALAEETDKLISSLIEGTEIEYDDIIDTSKNIDDWFDDDDFDMNELRD